MVGLDQGEDVVAAAGGGEERPALPCGGVEVEVFAVEVAYHLDGGGVLTDDEGLMCMRAFRDGEN